MDDMCFYSTTSYLDVESESVSVNQEEKMKPAPWAKKGKKNQTKQAWQKKEEKRTLNQHCKFNVQVISPIV